MYLSRQLINDFQEKILSWYAENQRDLPWRKTRDPYAILISEIMSQQTQISRVIPKYVAWIEAFPSVFDLAKATTVDVLTHWSGLGYNRRALYLQKAAQRIVADFNGIFPDDEKILQTLPGIGEYTASAIACFAFDKQIVVIDTNVRKVIITQFLIDSEEVGGRNEMKLIRHIAEQLLPHGRAYAWNQALMDYAGSVLKKEKISIPKQSKFKDSDRYYRGQIIKLLLEKQQITNAELHDHFNKKEQIVNQERLRNLIVGLEKDNLIKKNKEKIALP
jgi:A/G-specific adenine glycosylase